MLRYYGSNSHFWITTVGSFSDKDGDGNENGKKAIGLYQQNNNLPMHHTFLCIS